VLTISRTHWGTGGWISQEQGLWGARAAGVRVSTDPVQDFRALKVVFDDKEKLQIRGLCTSRMSMRQYEGSIGVGDAEFSSDWVSTISTLQTDIRSSFHDST